MCGGRGLAEFIVRDLGGKKNQFAATHEKGEMMIIAFRVVLLVDIAVLGARNMSIFFIVPDGIISIRSEFVY